MTLLLIALYCNPDILNNATASFVLLILSVIAATSALQVQCQGNYNKGYFVVVIIHARLKLNWVLYSYLNEYLLQH